MVLFLRNWIRSGVNKVRDLCFVDGKLDVDRMYDKIVHRGNIYTEILTVRKPLLPYQEYLKHGYRVSALHESHDFNPKRSKDFNIQFRNMLTNNVPIASNYLCKYCTFDDLTNIFRTKLVEEKEMKLREFNFKLLHGSLPCNSNLKRWKLRTTDNCDVCQEPQSIEHLLWKCDYVKPLWSIVEKVCDFEITYGKILGTDDCCKQDRVLTLMSFLVYKECLLLSLEGKKRSNNTMIQFYKSELELRLRIYGQCSCYEPYDFEYINMLLFHLSQ